MASSFSRRCFFYLGVRVYFVFIHQSSSGGWAARPQASDNRWHITYSEPNGPATALPSGDEFVAINGITKAQSSNDNRRVPLGTTYRMMLRRNKQELVISLQTVALCQNSNNFSDGHARGTVEGK